VVVSDLEKPSVIFACGTKTNHPVVVLE
jgi:hypothetical protein